MAMQRVKIACDSGVTVSLVREGGPRDFVESYVAGGRRDGSCFASLVDVPGNLVSANPSHVIAILVEPMSPEDEDDAKAEILTRSTE